jgi:hypothetical protein
LTPSLETRETRKPNRPTRTALLYLLATLSLGSVPSLGAQPAAADVQPGDPATHQRETTVTGRVIDSTGASVVGSKVSLSFSGNPAVLSAVTRTDGTFSILVPAPGIFDIAVFAQGFAAAHASGEVRTGEEVALPDIALAIAPVSIEVQVEGNTAAIAAGQVRAEEKQRILGVFPNYYVSYYEDTVPLRPKQKFDLAWKFTIDPVSFAIAGVIAGVRQANDSFSGYGQGAPGYGKRYAAAYGDFLTDTFLSNAILPSLLKQDPRYFYKGTGSKRSRILYALASSVICRGDNGRWQANYSNIIGGLASGAISNAYYPAGSRDGAALTFENAGINIGVTAAASLVQEFLFKKLTPHVPKDSSMRP